MNRFAAHLIAASIRSFGVDAQVLKTYRGLDYGKKYTSGKECYPCLVTLGDLLHFVEEEMRLGDGFSAEDYVYFMPESDGPCRFGLYNKYQRIVLDSLPGLKQLNIGAVTTTDSYSPDGLIEPENVASLKKAAYLSAVVADILERLTWRVRPYEKEPGARMPLSTAPFDAWSQLLKNTDPAIPMSRSWPRWMPSSGKLETSSTHGFRPNRASGSSVKYFSGCTRTPTRT